LVAERHWAEHSALNTSELKKKGKGTVSKVVHNPVLLIWLTQLCTAAGPDTPDEVQETLRLIKERQEAARIAQNIEKSPSPLQDYRQDDGMDIENFGNEDTLQEDAEMS
jgi:hypothetical protein